MCNLLTNQMQINLIAIRWIYISWVLDSITAIWYYTYEVFDWIFHLLFTFFYWLKLHSMNEEKNEKNSW